MTASYLALDIGGGSGRGIVGTLDGGRLILAEVHRFSNFHVHAAGKDYWDPYYLFHEMIVAAETALRRFPELRSLSVDLWGNDFALLDRRGDIVGWPRCTRNSDGSGMRTFFEKVMPERDYFRLCGCQLRPGNAVFQFYERQLEGDPALARAETFLMLPDLFGYLFTGRRFAEYTIATTGQLAALDGSGWNREMIAALGMPERLFPEIVLPGSRKYPILQKVLPGSVYYVPVASHDTASAVTTLTLGADEMFCSSGTWSIIGAESDRPDTSEMARLHNFSNEGTVDGRWRVQKDVMGMWCIQNLFRKAMAAQPELTWDEVVREAETAEPFCSIVNLEEPAFTSDADPAELVRRYCAATGQPVPWTLGQMARCIYESMALRYAQTIRELRSITGRTYRKLRIVGGGAKNMLLGQMTADATQIRLECGPYESACAGNILMQAVADGQIRKEDFPSILRVSFRPTVILPQPEAEKLWEPAIKRYQTYCEHTYL